MKRWGWAGLSGIIVLLFFISLLPTRATALSGSEFNAGRIVDDFVFFNPYTMSPDDIQRFLNAKVPFCDAWGAQARGGGTRGDYGIAQGYPPPYTCLKDYTQDTPVRSAEGGLCGGFGGGHKSAAQIIYEVGLSCGVNPQVLLVLLQKEQSLVTDDWPWTIQYRSATGYGCPDTAPCDAEFYGFFNQVYAAARQFKRYARDSSSYVYRPYRNNYIQWNPSASCGGSTVYLQNQATAGLYNYTPYQPNSAALNNLYGSGDSCSAYGNRNFWRIFREWFGSVYADDTDVAHPDGTVVTDGVKVYLINNNTRRHITTPTIFASHFLKWSQVKAASMGDKVLPLGDPVDYLSPGTVFYTNNSPVYVVDYENGVLKKRHLTYEGFKKLGYHWEEVIYVPPGEEPAATASQPLVSGRHPTGSLVINRQEGKVYYLEQNRRRYVGPASFNSYSFPWLSVKDATAEDINLPVGPQLEIKAGSMFYTDGIYVIEYDDYGALKRPVGPWECYAQRLHYTTSDWTYVVHEALPSRLGSRFTC